MHKNLSSKEKDLKKAGLKITEPRIKILKLFKNSPQKHLTADDVYKHLHEIEQNISITTIYRVLAQFEQADILKKHNFNGEQAIFEINCGTHHDHMMCVKCGKVSEFFNQKIEDLQVEIAYYKEFEITDHYMVLYGVCKKCNLIKDKL